MRDDRTEHRKYPLPHAENDLEVDVGRIRHALGEIDGDVEKAKPSVRLTSAFASLFKEEGHEGVLEEDDVLAISEALRKTFFASVDFWELFPAGLPVMWFQPLDKIPYDKGFRICDGTNGTINLLDRFIKSVPTADTEPGSVGGSNSLILTVENMPGHGHGFTGAAHKHTFTGTSHNHTGPSHNHAVSITSGSSGGHTHNFSQSQYENSSSGTSASGSRFEIGYSTGSSGINGAGLLLNLTAIATTWNKPTPTSSCKFVRLTIASNGAHQHAVSGNTGNSGTGNTGSTTAGGTIGNATATGTVGSTGGGQAFDNRPAYYECVFIMKVMKVAA